MKSTKEQVKTKAKQLGLTLSECKPNANLKRDRYYLVDGYNPVANFNNLADAEKFLHGYYSKLISKNLVV